MNIWNATVVIARFLHTKVSKAYGNLSLLPTVHHDANIYYYIFMEIDIHTTDLYNKYKQ